MTSVSVEVGVIRSGRVRQVEGMFDVPPAESSKLTWELPDELVNIDAEYDWSVGLIVGPSGSGKSTIARELWGARVIEAFDWPDDRSVLDAIDAPVRETVKALSAVGFGQPANWLRPYRVLSTGEQFRTTVARALMAADDPVIDEFTSVVDRQVAKVASAAVAKIVRRQEKRLIAVTCHYDVIDWLQPDWVFKPDTGEMKRRRLQRHPQLDLEIRWIDRSAWELFRKYHYLSGKLHTAAKCMGGFLGDECIAFQAYYRRPHPVAKDLIAGHRTVVLPDYQGLGIGAKIKDFAAQYVAQQGYRYRTTLAHPVLVASHRKSPRWKEIAGQNKPSVSNKPKRLVKQHAQTRKLATTTFEYVPIG